MSLKERFYTAEEVAKIIGVTPQTARKMVTEGRIKGVKVGRAFRVPESAVRELLAVPEEVHPNPLQAREDVITIPAELARTAERSLRKWLVYRKGRTEEEKQAVIELQAVMQQALKEMDGKLEDGQETPIHL